MNTNPKIGQVLISEPFLEDPNFNRTVVLITENNSEGTVGFVLNQKTDFSVELLIPELDTVPNTIYQGGPVDIESFHFLHRCEEIPNSVKLGERLYWSGDFEFTAKGLLDGSLDPQKFKFFIGYSGWAPEQLELELKEKAWVVGEIEASDVLAQDIDDKILWQKVMTDLGGEYAILANSPINPQLN